MNAYRLTRSSRAAERLIDPPRRLVGLAAVWVLVCGLKVPAVAASEDRAEIQCGPQVLYRGETLHVRVLGSHHGYDLGVTQGGTGVLLLISFKPSRGDSATPAISPEEFARARDFDIHPDSIRGVPTNSWGEWQSTRSDEAKKIVVPRELKEPEKIFTKTGTYVVELGQDLGGDLHDDYAEGSCPVEYIDSPRPASEPPIVTGPNSEVAFDAYVNSLSCWPNPLYRGDTLKIPLSDLHDGFDFAVSRPLSDRPILVSFKRGPNYKIAPAIAPEDFAKMREVTLATASARGSPANWWKDPDLPRALKPPEKIFTRTGVYQILLGEVLGSKPVEVKACWVDYFDHPRPKSKKSAGAPTP